MARIRVDPEQMRFVARQYWNANYALGSLQSTIRSADYTLYTDALEGKARTFIESVLSQAESASCGVTVDSQNLASTLSSDS